MTAHAIPKREITTRRKKCKFHNYDC